MKILVDSREKTPWEWDGQDDIEIEHTKLDTGDYTIEGLENVIMLERKANPDEIYNNVSSKKSKARLYREIERFKDAKYKFLVIECRYEDIVNPKSYYINRRFKSKFSPFMPCAVVRDNLVRLMIDYGIQVIFAGNEGESIVKHILTSVYKKEHANIK